MAFPSKSRRTITVKGKAFYWRVVGIDEPEFGFAVWEPSKPNSTFMRVCVGDPMTAVTSSMVAQAIEDELGCRE